MNLTKILYGALGGTLSIIVLLLNAWGHDMTTRVNALEEARNASDKNYAVLLEEMQDLRQHFDDLKKELENKNVQQH